VIDNSLSKRQCAKKGGSHERSIARFNSAAYMVALSATYATLTNESNLSPPGGPQA